MKSSLDQEAIARMEDALSSRTLQLTYKLDYRNLLVKWRETAKAEEAYDILERIEGLLDKYSIEYIVTDYAENSEFLDALQS